MTLSILQLNINADNFWDKLIPFLTMHHFDILMFQEVCGKDTINGNINSKRDCFKELQKTFADRYRGELAIAERFTSSPDSYIGQAIFYKRSFSLLEKTVFPLYQRGVPFPSESENFEDESRVLLHLTLGTDNKRISFLNLHGAWAKIATEHDHQKVQGERLLSYLRNVQPPFIFSGDLNLNPQQPTVQKISELARNLITEYQVTKTLNPRTHRSQEVFPEGVAVDYIFVSKDITVKNFTVIEDDISDHVGLVVEIEI